MAHVEHVCRFIAFGRPLDPSFGGVGRATNEVVAKRGTPTQMVVLVGEASKNAYKIQVLK